MAADNSGTLNAAGTNYFRIGTTMGMKARKNSVCVGQDFIGVTVIGWTDRQGTIPPTFK
jgi:hypothetical protein